MKNSEIARYWAAKELTRIDRAENQVRFKAPYACPAFTVRVATRPPGEVRTLVEGKPQPLTEVRRALDLKAGTWFRDRDAVTVCFDLPKAESALTW
jgi:hypothetical protein